MFQMYLITEEVALLYVFNLSSKKNHWNEKRFRMKEVDESSFTPKDRLFYISNLYNNNYYYFLNSVA